MRFSLFTLGCKVNQSEVNTMESALMSSGHEIVSLSESPEICIVNTCAVTAKSDYQSRQYIRRAIKSGAKVYATGCYAHLKKGEIRSRVSDSVEILDNDNKFNIINIYASNSKCNTLKINRNRAFVKIQDGCNYSCSYCTIPLARGRSRSLSPGTIIEEIARLHASGINEVVLTGIHIGLYGNDLSPKIGLKFLLTSILSRTMVPRIRLSSLEIGEIDDEFLDLIYDKRVCKHLHIPLQSGDDSVLRNMNRMYTAVQFQRRLDAIILKYPDISIGSDVIVGFPGEGSNEFSNTFQLLRHSGMAYFHIFPYSKRNNTPASSMSNHVDTATIKDRVRLLRSLSDEKKMTYMKRFVGYELDVIVEENAAEGIYSSTSGNYLKVKLYADTLMQGSLVSAHIDGIEDGQLRGTPQQQ